MGQASAEKERERWGGKKKQEALSKDACLPSSPFQTPASTITLLSQNITTF